MRATETDFSTVLRKHAESGSTRAAWPWILFAVALVVRVVVLVVTQRNRQSWSAIELPDEQQYWLIASNLVEGLGLRDEIGHRAGRMPLYPGFLALFAWFPNGIVVAKLAHIVLGSALAAVTYRLARIVGGVPAATIAGSLVAFDPFLAFFSTLLLTETPFCLCLTLLFSIMLPWVLDADRKIGRGEWFAATALAIVLIYLRESSVGLIAVLIAFTVVVRPFEARIVRGAILTLLFIVSSLVPWALRNSNVIGSWKWLTTRGGISLYDGVGPQANGSSNLGDVKLMPDVINLDEVEYDRYFHDKSFMMMRNNPQRILSLAITKFRNTWSLFPNAAGFQSRGTRVVSAAWTIPTFTLSALGVILMARRRGVYARISMFLLLPAIYLTAVHMIFVGSIRYRLGAIPMIAVFAAFGVVSLAGVIRGRRYSE